MILENYQTKSNTYLHFFITHFFIYYLL